jgi:hypothetical protein
VDGLTPECETDVGCPVPPLPGGAVRIMEIRSLLVRLQGAVDPGTICRICEVDRDDLELLAIVEEELKANTPQTDQE